MAFRDWRPTGDDHGPRPRRKLGPRRQRLRRMALVLAIIAGVAIVGGFAAYQTTRPETRRPGERLEDITDRLVQDVATDAPEPRFVDVTAAAGLGEFRTFLGTRSSQLPEDMGSGAAWGDYDNDGDDDLFLVAAGGSLEDDPSGWAPSQLFENRGDGTFRRDETFPDLRISGMAAAWGDHDHDGWLDLVVTGYQTLALFSNREGRLVPGPTLPAAAGYYSGAAWGDFDNDRDLDLYICGYVQYAATEAPTGRPARQYGAAVPFTLNPASFAPAPNLLFRNDGGGHFEEVALLWGVSNPEGRSLGALWHDFDQDGRLDLYVANDISDNALFLNRGHTFEDVSLTSRMADYRGAMGLAPGDWNRDGDDDLFITHWVAQENALYDSRLRDEGGAAPAGKLTFSDVSARLGLGSSALPMVGWGTELADLDSDGWLDLVVINGSTIEEQAAPERLQPQRPFLFWNRRGEYFDDLAPKNDSLAVAHVGRGMAQADYDLDGDLDILIVHLGEGVQLLRNDMAQGGWLELRLRARSPGHGEPAGYGEGSTVIVRADDVELRRSVTGVSYLSQSSRVVHVGLGAAPQADEVEIQWLGGEPQIFGPFPANSRWELVEGDPDPRLLSHQNAPLTREQIREFWRHQRAGMDALKREGDLEKAIGAFKKALALDPDHEDSRYYLANCLAATGQHQAALDELGRLRRDNPQSHRGQRQWAVLRALTATSHADLVAAQDAALAALEVNREETGSLLLLGELALILGDFDLAEERLEQATRTNPKAVGGFFLGSFIASRRGDREKSLALLQRAREALGAEWKPAGAAAEGDVARHMHDEETPLSRFWTAWDGEATPEAAYNGLAKHLNGLASLPRQ